MNKTPPEPKANPATLDAAAAFSRVAAPVRLIQVIVLDSIASAVFGLAFGLDLVLAGETSWRRLILAIAVGLAGILALSTHRFSRMIACGFNFLGAAACIAKAWTMTMARGHAANAPEPSPYWHQQELIEIFVAGALGVILLVCGRRLMQALGVKLPE